MKKILFIALLMFSFNTLSVSALEEETAPAEVKILMVDENGNASSEEIKETEILETEILEKEVEATDPSEPIYYTTEEPDSEVTNEVKRGEEMYQNTSVDVNADDTAEMATTSIKEDNNNLVYYIGGGAVVLAAGAGIYLLRKKQEN